jgi:hypothetical protein
MYRLFPSQSKEGSSVACPLAGSTADPHEVILVGLSVLYIFRSELVRRNDK